MPAASVDTETAAAAETEALAADLAAGLQPGDVVLVSGELGTGKTTFVRGACRALGVAVPVTSPTFTIARRYEDGRVPVSHLDLFRLGDGLDEEEPELLEEELGPDRVAFVEWPEVAGSDPAGVRVAARVRLEHRGGDRRRVVIEQRAVTTGPPTAMPRGRQGSPLGTRSSGSTPPRRTRWWASRSTARRRSSCATRPRPASARATSPSCCRWRRRCSSAPA
jgi:tRNA threonylcarbamoyladenosine biosynthesis protein TsaE